MDSLKDAVLKALQERKGLTIKIEMPDGDEKVLGSEALDLNDVVEKDDEKVEEKPAEKVEQKVEEKPEDDEEMKSLVAIVGGSQGVDKEALDMEGKEPKSIGDKAKMAALKRIAELKK